ncbi:MAG TPA: hypothetical protein PLK82_05635 [Bacteroidales bacterium]|nr:hypothetical protein [Bacteroidales bacterium]
MIRTSAPQLISFFLVLAMIVARAAFGQVGINNDGSAPNASAMLDVKSNVRGFLPPRMTQAERNAIVNPAEGLMVICTDCGADNPVAMSVYLNGSWWLLTGYCPVPGTPVAGNHISAGNQIIWKWSPIESASRYRWSDTNDFATATVLGTEPVHTETGLSCDLTYTRFAWAENVCGHSGAAILTASTGGPVSPVAGVHIPGPNQVTWSWYPVAGAAGYKWGITDDFSTATDLGSDTTIMETGLLCNTLFTRYVWAYSGCGHSPVRNLSATTTLCIQFSCGTDSLVIHHHVANGVAPVNKLTKYGTIANVPGEMGKCWITKNLGADRQAFWVEDPFESSAGWYWQFNRKQGYKHNGTSRTPNTTWITDISENSDWLRVNDPCNIELGSAWRIPTITEWINVDAAGGWITWSGPWSSGLKLHATGNLNQNDGSLQTRGGRGLYWANSQLSGSNVSGRMYFFANNFSWDGHGIKTFGNSLRCIRKTCTTTPGTPVQGIHDPGCSFISWKWGSVAGADGYKWNTMDDYSTAVNMGLDTVKAETGLSCNTTYYRYVWAYNDCGNSSPVMLVQAPASSPPPPASATNFPAAEEIIWNWAPVDKATGYKWNITSDYSTAIDLGLSTSKKETGLTCNTNYTRYVWAYCGCGASTPLVISASTQHCGPFTCGTDSLFSDHVTSNGVAPVNKVLYYHTVLNIPGEPAKCWITKNLGADHQAADVDDGSEPSAGWYWQFNRKQGHKYDGNAIPDWTINSINEYSNWLASNDPCRSELGDLWRIPSYTEWVNVSNAGGWNDYHGPWNSALKLHFGGWVNTNGALQNRGYLGVFWTSVQEDNATAKDFHFDWFSFVIMTGNKAEGFPLRCLMDTCTMSSAAPSAASHVPAVTQITWNWIAVPGASGYKWNTINDIASATDMGYSLSKTETGLNCNTLYNRYVWAYNGCGNSTPVLLTQTTLVDIPATPVSGVNIPGQTQITWNWAPVIGATGYKWNATNDFATAEDMGTAVSKFENGLTCNTPYTRFVWAYGNCGGHSGAGLMSQATLNDIPASPVPGTNVSAVTQITWNWNTVTGATGYKWSATNNYATATDMGSATTKTENGLTCNTPYTRYVWAYSACSPSTVLTLIATTSACPMCYADSLLVNHQVSGGVAPVDKNTKYGTVKGVPGEPAKCWITKNLGADRQATAVDDATEPSAGWYWQFNRKQGRKFDPDATPLWTITSISENSDWLIANDPCQAELGGAWRIPTHTEWTNVAGAGGWTNSTGPWNSALKLHYGGWVNTSGTLNNRGSAGVFWTSSQSDDSNAKDFVFTGSSFSLQTGIKPEAFPLRCLSDTICQAVPPQAPSSGIHILGDNSIFWRWNAVSCATGYKWSANNDFATATDLDVATAMFETGLTASTAYTRYVWAYNGNGPSSVLTLTATTTAAFPCGDSLAVNHQVSGGVAPVAKNTKYGTVTNVPGEPAKCWITKNLGADRQATAVSDATEPSAGWYWQFNLKQGYKHDGTDRTPNTTWITSINQNSDWTATQDPCKLELGTSWRIPTATEWNNVKTSGGWTNWTGTWNSLLKLHAAGDLLWNAGTLEWRGQGGDFWSVSQTAANTANWLGFNSSGCAVNNDLKTFGFTIRCLKD